MMEPHAHISALARAEPVLSYPRHFMSIPRVNRTDIETLRPSFAQDVSMTGLRKDPHRLVQRAAPTHPRVWVEKVCQG